MIYDWVQVPINYNANAIKYNTTFLIFDKIESHHNTFMQSVS